MKSAFAERTIFVCLLFAISLISTACQRSGSRTELKDPLRKLVPGDATSLAEAQVDKLHTSPLYLQIREKYHFGTPVIMAIGFDPNRDLRTMLLCWDGKEFSLAAEGQFRKAVIETFLSARSRKQSVEGFALFQLGKQTLTILDENLAFAAPDAATVQQAVERFRAAGDQFPAALQTALAWLPAADQIRIVSRGELPFADVPMRSDWASILANFRGYVRTSSLGLALDRDVHLKGRVECVSAVGSKRVYDALRAGLGVARLSVKSNDRDLLSAYNAIKISEQSSVVYLQADLQGALAESLLAHLLQPRL